MAVLYGLAAIVLMAIPTNTLAPHALARRHPCTPILAPPLGLRGGADAANAVAAQQQPVSLWTSLFALAFAGTLATAQLASKDLIPGRSLLKYQIVCKERLPDLARGGNASVLRLVMSTHPARPETEDSTPETETEAKTEAQEIREDNSGHSDTQKAGEGIKDGTTAGKEGGIIDLVAINKHLTLPTEFDLAGDDHMLWYRLHDMELMKHVNKAMLMALHYHLTKTPAAPARLLKLVLRASDLKERGAEGQNGLVSSHEHTTPVPNIVDYGICRGQLGEQVERLLVRRASDREMLAFARNSEREAKPSAAAAEATAGRAAAEAPEAGAVGEAHASVDDRSSHGTRTAGAGEDYQEEDYKDDYKEDQHRKVRFQKLHYIIDIYIV